jgi:hypothetical protein
MLRLTEILLFLAPFAAFAIWRLSVDIGGPPRSVVIGAACFALLMLGLLVYLRENRALPPGTHYVPAHVEDGHIVPGHGTP